MDGSGLLRQKCCKSCKAASDSPANNNCTNTSCYDKFAQCTEWGKYEAQCQNPQTAKDCCKSCQKAESKGESRGNSGSCVDELSQCKFYAKQYDCNTVKLQVNTNGITQRKLMKDACCNACMQGPDKSRVTDSNAGMPGQQATGYCQDHLSACPQYA